MVLVGSGMMSIIMRYVLPNRLLLYCCLTISYLRREGRSMRLAQQQVRAAACSCSSRFVQQQVCAAAVCSGQMDSCMTRITRCAQEDFHVIHAVILHSNNSGHWQSGCRRRHVPTSLDAVPHLPKTAFATAASHQQHNCELHCALTLRTTS